MKLFHAKVTDRFPFENVLYLDLISMFSAWASALYLVCSTKKIWLFCKHFTFYIAGDIYDGKSNS